MKKSLLFIASLITILSLQAQNIIYVDIDATGTSNGSSWANAYTDPQNAFSNASTGDEVWIAEGLYAKNSSFRNSSFFWSVDSLTVLGGFNGTETAVSQRNTNAYHTILSGEISNNGNVTDNAFTVLKGPQGSSSNPITFSLIDGITIQDGYAEDINSGETKWGAGFLLQDYVERIEFNDCTFRNNYAQGGAALFLQCTHSDVEVLISNCVIEENIGDYSPAIVSTVYSEYLKLEVINSLIVNNLTKSFTGATTLGSCFYFNSNGDSDINFYNTTISNNVDSTSGNGGTRNLIFYYVGLNNGSNNLNIQNSIMYNNINTTRTIAEFTASHYPFTSIKVNSSISEVNSYEATTVLSDVITADPLFNNSQNDFNLGNGSPAINTGSQNGINVLIEDLNGDTRIVGPEIDMGCYEKTCGQWSFNIDENAGVLSAPASLVSFQWSLDGTEISGATSNTYTPTISGLYTVEVYNGICYQTRNYFFCANETITLTESNGVITAPTGYSNYDWYVDGSYNIAAGNSNTFTPNQDGEIYCEVLFGSGPNSCIFTSSTITFCTSVNVSITESNDTLFATTGYAAYQWYQDSIVIVGATNDTYKATVSGAYYCEASDSTCSSTSNSIQVTVDSVGTSIQSLAFQNLKVYPNPTSNVVNIVVDETLTSIRLMDLSGRTIQEYQASSTQINIAEFNTGIYFLELANAKKRSILKIIKH